MGMGNATADRIFFFFDKFFLEISLPMLMWCAKGADYYFPF